MKQLRLGVNIDHVATIRNARGGEHPDPVRAAIIAAKAGADGITAHLREDRRHITDNDILRLKAEINLPLNLEMAATEEMLSIALRTKPDFVCIVPEKRAERTTEGGLDVIANHAALKPLIAKLRDKQIKVSLFVEPIEAQILKAKELEAEAIEIHTGKYSHITGEAQEEELNRIKKAAEFSSSLGMKTHAGHGLRYDNVLSIAQISQIEELNIGHYLIGEAVFLGLEESIKKMREIMDIAKAF